MAVTDLHSLDVSTTLKGIFTSGKANLGAVLSLVPYTPSINVGKNVPLVLGPRAKGALVHEGGKKPDNGRKITTKPFETVKLVYSQRVTDEFLNWETNRQEDFVSLLISDWVNKSLGRDIDTVVIHGYDPHAGTKDEQITNNLTAACAANKVESTGDDGAAVDADLTSLIARLEGQDINGVAISTKAAQALSTLAEGNVQKYPGTGVFGLMGDSLAGIKAASSPEVGAVDDTKIIIGDFNQLMVGFAGSADWRVLTAGNPDGGDSDLQQTNQVCIRLEQRFGFQVLDTAAFAYITKAAD